MIVNRPDRAILESVIGAAALAERPHLFSNVQVTLSRSVYEQIARFVSDVTTLV